MGLITGPFTAPFKGVTRIAEILREQAEQELHDPAAVRRRLEDVEGARERGEISAEEEAEAQDEILAGLVHQPAEADPQATEDGPGEDEPGEDEPRA